MQYFGMIQFPRVCLRQALAYSFQFPDFFAFIQTRIVQDVSGCAVFVEARSHAGVHQIDVVFDAGRVRDAVFFGSLDAVFDGAAQGCGVRGAVRHVVLEGGLHFVDKPVRHGFFKEQAILFGEVDRHLRSYAAAPIRV